MQPSVNKSKPIWYFAFGQQQKSSLLNEYAREHHLVYVKEVPKSSDLQKYKNQSCIIQADVKTLLQWQPIVSNIEVIFIGESFKQDELQVKKDYQQIAKCKYHPTFTNYQQFRKLMHPNLIFFYGPHQQHRQGAAATIAFQSSYCYMNKLLKSANQIVSKLDLTQNYTFSNLFTVPNEIAVLESRFNLRIIHFKFNRNDFSNMDEYFDQQHQIIKYLHGKPYFWSVDGHQSPQKMMDQIGQILCPEITYINANNPTQKAYAQKYTNDKNTAALSIFAIQSINKRKGLPLAYTLKQKILLINSIIYRDLKLKQIVLVDFPYHVNEVRLFEQLNRKFTRFVELDLAEEWMYSKQYTSGMYFLETQRFLRPDMNYELKGQVEKSKKYWLVTGAQGAGKTTVAKYMAEQYGMKLIQIDNYLTQLKEKLLTPQDGEELPIQKILNHFQQLFSQSSQQQFILDNFPFDPKKWMTSIGVPHVISLKVDANELIKRQRKKNQADLTAQIGEEQLTKAQQSITQAQQLTQNFNEASSQTVTYTLDYNCTILQSQKLLSTIYQPRVFLIQSMPTLLYHNIALRHDCAFYNLAINSLEEIKKLVKQGNKRNVIISGYQQVEGKMVSEDLYWIQKNIGKIRYVAICNDEPKDFDQQFIPLERPVIQKPKKVQQQGEQEPEQQPPEEQEEGEPKKKVLDIYAYQWTKPVCHKNLTQWYFKLKKTVQEFTLSEKEVYKRFEQKLKKINQNAGVNIYEVVKTDGSE